MATKQELFAQAESASEPARKEALYKQILGELRRAMEGWIKMD